MNLEERAKLLDRINKLEGLLQWALEHGETAEAERLRQALASIVENL